MELKLYFGIECFIGYIPHQFFEEPLYDANNVERTHMSKQASMNTIEISTLHP